MASFVQGPPPERARILDEAEAEALSAEILEAVGGEDGWRRIYADRDAAREYLGAHRDALLDRYPYQEIALHRDRVVVHAADPDEFSRLLEEYLASSGVDRNRLHFEFLDPDPPLFVG